MSEHIPPYVWTRDKGIDTVHRAGCQHTRMAPQVLSLAADTVDEAQREIALAMGWENWPNGLHEAAFLINVAACAR